MCARCENLSKPTTTASARSRCRRCPHPFSLYVYVCASSQKTNKKKQKKFTKPTNKTKHTKREKEVAIKSRINSLSWSRSRSRSRVVAKRLGSIYSKTQLLIILFACTNAFMYIQFVYTNRRRVCCRCLACKIFARKQK